MELFVRSEPPGPVIDVSGRLVFGAPVWDLHNTIRQLVGQGHSSITVNLDQVSYLDSTGLQVVISSYATCARSNVRLGLTNVNPRITTVLRVTGLGVMLEGLLGEN